MNIYLPATQIWTKQYKKMAVWMILFIYLFIRNFAPVNR